MRRILGLALVVAGLGSGAGLARADEDRDRALAVINEAIRAHGGEERLTRAQTQTRTGAGVMTLFGKDLPFTDEVALQLPDRLRVALEVDKKLRFLIVINQDRGWQSSGGMINEMGKERLGEVREEAHVLWLTTLVPLRKAPFVLALLPETRVGDQPAAAVKVSAKGHGDALLFFDRRTGYLVKIARRAREAGLEVDKEYFYAGHKSFDGTMLPTRMTELLNGKKFSELQSIDYRFPRQIDEAQFSKP